MICNKCGKEVPDNYKFCPFCATNLVNNNVNTVIEPVQNINTQPQQVNQLTPQPVIQNQIVQPTKSFFTKGQKIIIFSLLLVILIIIGFIVFNKDSNVLKKKDDTRTIFIYLEGSDLESDSGIATADITSLKSSKIDLDKVNILLYTGGTKEWKNDFISNEENAIFLFTEDGFEKVKTLDKSNMGDPSTLTYFLNYGYENYEAGHYDLIIYDHGAALAGAVIDDFTGDLLSLEDFKNALKNSSFKNNKFDTVIFRTCLNGTLEIANLFKDYAEYIVFSEEVSWGSNNSNVLSFVNNLKIDDNGDNVGRKFVDRYKKQMEEIDIYGTAGFTYSIIDLSKIDKVIEELDTFIEGIDLKKDYSNISRVRGNLYQYGYGNDVYDTIDLISFIKQIEKYSSVKADKLLNALDDAIIYNNTNIKESNGISIYFPFKGKSAMGRFLNVYKKLDFSENYESFINSFYNTLLNGDRTEFALSKDTFNVNDNKEVTLFLSEEEINNYSYSIYYVFKRDDEHPNYYKYIYCSDDTIVDGNNLTTNIGNNLIKVKDEDGSEYIPLNHSTKGGLNSYAISGILMDELGFTQKGHSFVSTIKYYFDNNVPKIGSATITSADDERLLGVFLDLDKFNLVQLFFFEYKLLDANGNVVSNWESPPEKRGVEGYINELEFEKASIDDDGEYYVLFKIFDLNNESHFSKLMKVGM